jgi:hypothetical protein
MCVHAQATPHPHVRTHAYAAHVSRALWLLSCVSADEMRCYWFEIFECLRKLALISIPAFLPADTMARLICSLVICFLSYGVHKALEPFEEDGDDVLAQIAQRNHPRLATLGLCTAALPTRPAHCC